MKKYLFLIIIYFCCLPPVTAFATDYFGCASASLNADNTFCTTPTGSCAGSSAVSAATALQAGNNLYANGCTISISDNFTATKISTEDGDGAGAAVSGGGFTWATAGGDKTFTTNIVAGSSTCLTISGTTSGSVGTIIGDVTGGTSASCHGVSDAHSVGTITIHGNLYGSATIANSRAYVVNSNSGKVDITGSSTGNASIGIQSIGSVYFTVDGNCIGSDSSYVASGCESSGTGAAVIKGNIINNKSVGATGNIKLNPTAYNYIRIQSSSSGYLYLSIPLPEDDVKLGVTYGFDGYGYYTGSYSSGGSTAYAY